MFQPLKGLRVIDLTQVLAGPYSTYQLALMGAEVIKIEKPGSGDWTREGQGLPGHEGQGMGAGFLTQNANKKSVAIDLKQAAGIGLVKKLIASADIFVENFRPGTAAGLGLAFDDVKAVNPTVLYCSISAYGQDGPYGHRPAYDHVVQGMCGIMQSTGSPETVPNKVGAPYIDYVTGLNAAFAMLAGMQQVKATNKALRLDVAMLDSAMLLMSSMLTQSLSLGMEHEANGNEAFSRSPSSGAFTTTNGTLMIAANNPRQFASLCEALGRADILADERWSSPAARKQNADALREEFSAIIAGNDADHWEAVLSEHRVPAARVRTIGEALRGEQLIARELMAAMPMAGSDTPAYVPTLGFKVDGSVTAPQLAPPRLGADTDSVLESIGLSEAERRELNEAGVISGTSA